MPGPITGGDSIVEGEQGGDEGVDGGRGKRVLCNHQPTLRGSVLILAINKRRQGDSIRRHLAVPPPLPSSGHPFSTDGRGSHTFRIPLLFLFFFFLPFFHPEFLLFSNYFFFFFFFTNFPFYFYFVICFTTRNDFRATIIQETRDAHVFFIRRSIL